MPKRLILLVEITSPPPDFGGLAITTGLVQPTLGAFTSQTLVAVGGSGAYTWQLLGNVPPGISIDRSTGVVSGAWGSRGSFNFYARVADEVGQFATRAFSWSVPLTGGSPPPDPPDAADAYVVASSSAWFDFSSGIIGEGALPAKTVAQAITELEAYIGTARADFAPILGVIPGTYNSSGVDFTVPESYSFGLGVSLLSDREFADYTDVADIVSSTLVVTEAAVVELDACGHDLTSVTDIGSLDTSAFTVTFPFAGFMELQFAGMASPPVPSGAITSVLVRMEGTVTTSSDTYTVDCIVNLIWNTCF